MGTYFSFHHDTDAWRARRVMRLARSSHQEWLDRDGWAAVTARGDDEARRWIDEQMQFSGAVVVLIGSHTDRCAWVRYEILRAWKECRPLLGVRVHGLMDHTGATGEVGPSPFHHLKFRSAGHMSDYVPVFQPEGHDEVTIRESIAAELPGWIAKGARRMEPRPPRSLALPGLRRR